MGETPFWAAREYDLGRRPGGREPRHFVCQDVFNLLDAGGTVVHRESRRAHLNSESLRWSAERGPLLRWTYSDFELEINGSDVTDPSAFPEEGAISFESSPEDPDSYVPPVEDLGLDVTSPSAWLTAELVIHTRAFEIMATRKHGGIEKLRRLGDETTMPWSVAQHRVCFGAMIDATIKREESVLRFDGMTVRAGREAALLSCRTPYELVAVGLGPTHIDLTGQLWLDVDSGELIAAAARQVNYIASAPYPDGTRAPMNHLFETTVDLVP